MRLTPLDFEQLPGWQPSELPAAWPAFLASCRAVATFAPPLRVGRPASSEFVELSSRALEIGDNPDAVSRFFRENFRPFEVLADTGAGEGFVTGYYEPELEGSSTRTTEFTAPVLARPKDLIDMREADVTGWDRSLQGARRTADGRLAPYPSRAEIENCILGDLAAPVVWLRDHVEVFFAQVQGSARVRLTDGSRKRLVYAGRNGRSYTSIGRILINEGEIAPEDMSLSSCKAWLRGNGVQIGDRGRTIMQRNESYVFFRLEDDPDTRIGPTGGQGIPLWPLRSMAVDRAVWPYGTPIWIGADLTTAGLGAGPTGRLMIAQDTGSAIVGPARGDLFIGSGARAGEIAGLIRHSARFIVLLPVGFVA